MPTVAELAQQELNRRYSLQGRTQVAPRPQTMQNVRPTIRSALSNLMRDAVDATGLGGGYRQGLLNAAGGVETAVDFLPVVGDAIAVDDAARAYGQGDMLGAGINMMSVVPVVGDVAAKGAKTARSSLRNIYHGTSPEAAKAIDELGFDLDMTADGSAWFTTNPDIGEVAAAGKGGVIQRQLDESNLKLASYDETDKYLKDQLIDMGYDGAYYPDGEGGAHYEIWNQDKLNKLSPLTGLDMNPEARMQRAQDLGFDTSRPLYHSTNSSFDAFEVPEGGFLKYGKGVYTTPKPQYADRYIRENRDLDRAYKEGANVMPLYARGNIATEQDWEAARQDMMSEGVSPSGYNQQQAELQRRLKEQGFDGLNMFGDEIIIFDPKNIRSTNAEFDPEKMDSADLLSSVGTTSALRGIA